MGDPLLQNARCTASSSPLAGDAFAQRLFESPARRFIGACGESLLRGRPHQALIANSFDAFLSDLCCPYQPRQHLLRAPSERGDHQIDAHPLTFGPDIPTIAGIRFMSKRALVREASITASRPHAFEQHRPKDASSWRALEERQANKDKV